MADTKTVEAESWLEINGVRYDFPDSITLGEARTIKRMTGMSLGEFSELFGEGKPRTSDPDVMAAIIYLVMHRKDPRVTEADIDTLDLDMITDGGTAGVAELPLEPTAASTETLSPPSVDVSEDSVVPSPVTTLRTFGAHG